MAALGIATATAVAQAPLLGPSAAERERQKRQDEEDALAWGPCACCAWVIKPTTKWCPSKFQFIVWCLLAIFAIYFFFEYLKDETDGTLFNWGYIFCCSISVIMAFYAMSLFKDLANLREILEKMQKGEKQIKENLEKIQGELGRIIGIHDKLSYLEMEQSVSNAQLRSQRKQFLEWTKMSMDLTQKGAAQMQLIRNEMEVGVRKKEREIEFNEKGIMFNAFRVFERDPDGDGLPGLNRLEFEMFIKALPKRYRTRLADSGRKFEDFDKDGNGVIRGSEFRDFLENMVEAEVRFLAKAYNIGTDVFELKGLDEAVHTSNDEEPVKEQESKPIVGDHVNDEGDQGQDLAINEDLDVAVDDNLDSAIDQESPIAGNT